MKKYLMVLVALLTPLTAFGATTVDTLLGDTIPDWLDYLIGIGFTLALMFFIWGIALFILKSGSEEAAADGKRKMLWGITALFVITAIWGIVKFIESSLLGNDSAKTVTVPEIPKKAP
jgi:hypothetical protein